MHYVNVNVLSTTDAGSHNGIQIDSQLYVSASFQAVFSDTSVAGSVKVQASNDLNKDNYQANAFTVTNWTDIPNTSTSITAGASALVTIPSCAYRWMRVVFTETTPGTGTVNVNMHAIYA